DPRHRYGEPRAFLRRCVESYQRAGFRRVVPLLGTEAGAVLLGEWIDEARRMGLPWHIWTSQSLRGLGCAALQPGGVASPASPAPPAPPPAPAPSPPASSGGGWELGALLLLAYGVS